MPTCTSSGAGGGGSGRGAKQAKLDWTQPIDASTLTEKQIHMLTQQRYDIWEPLYKETKAKKAIQEPSLTKTQVSAYQKMYYNDDYSSLDKLSVKTLQAVKSRAVYDYDHSARQLVRAGYDVRNDYSNNSSGRRIQSGQFSEHYANMRKATQMELAIDKALERKGVKTSPREITSSTYKRDVAKNTKRVNAMFKNRR